MTIEDFLYSLGSGVENLVKRSVSVVREIITPSPTEMPPKFDFLKRFIKRDLTAHEFVSLKLQLSILVYLSLSIVGVILRSAFLLLALFVLEFAYVRYILLRNWNFVLEPEQYRFFYYGLSFLAFASFLGYLLLQEVSRNPYYYMAYLSIVFIAVFLFRHYFKSRYGRDYTYGVVEEVKNDMVRVFVHDDIAANVKPGYYWVPAVQDAEPGRVVKLLVEDRNLRGARPVRILEVYLSSSQSSTDPNEQIE